MLKFMSSKNADNCKGPLGSFGAYVLEVYCESFKHMKGLCAGNLSGKVQENDYFTESIHSPRSFFFWFPAQFSTGCMWALAH